VTNVRVSLAYSAAASYVTMALQLLSTAVLARLLTPEQIGTFAVAAVFTALAGAFRNFGVTEYLIQQRELDTQTIRAALTVNILVSWSLGMLLTIGAQTVAQFFRTEEVAAVMYVQAASFAIIPFGAITMAYFRRELNLRPILISTTLANVASLVVAVILAWQGFGHMSLAWSGLAGTVATVAVSLWFRPSTLPFWPGIRGTREAFRFGRHASAIYLFEQMGKGAPEMIIGRAAGIAPVAYYSRANGLLELFDKLVLNAVWPIVLPIFSKRERESGGLLAAYLLGTAYLTVVSWPIIFFMGLMAFPAVRIVYGVQWMESVELAQILCVAMVLWMPYHLGKEALIARGQVKESSHLQLGIQGLRIIGLLAVVPFGLVGACWGVVFGMAGGAVLSHRRLARSISLTTRELAAAVLPSLRIAFLVNLPVALLTWLVPPTEENFAWLGLLGGLFCAGGWLLAVWQTRHPIWIECVSVGRAARQRLPVRWQGS